MRLAVVAAITATATACSPDKPAAPPAPRPWTAIIDAPPRTPAVTVTGIRPALGPVGQWVYVFGSGFVPGHTTVAVGGAAPVDANVYDFDQLGFTVPATATGSTAVTVTVDHDTATSAQLYTVGIPREPPRIDALEPGQGEPGTAIVATGANFVFGQTTIIVDRIPTDGGVYDPETLWFTIPSDVTHSGRITIKTPNGTATSTVELRVITAERAP